MHFENKPIYKACSPEETIEKARKTLADVGIFLSENSVYHKESQTAACSIYFGDEPFIGTKLATNGKGMNPRYSLASAHGEMMERLQAGLFFRSEHKKAHIDGHISYYYAPDEKLIPFSQLCPEALDSIKEMLKLSDEGWTSLYDAIKDVQVICVPYLDALSSRTLYMPIDIYYLLFTSNGMCAGNTREEALSQGLSEVFERATLTEIYYKNPELRQLKPECFEGSEVLKKLEHLKTLGFGYKIIDGSMDKEYPVMGLILEKDGQIMFNLGADPNPVVALERCLTELFQCIREDDYVKRLCKESCGLYSDWKFNVQKRWYHSQFVRAKVGGYGDRPDNLLNVPEKFSETYSYNSENVDDFEYHLKLIKKLGYHLYIRDFSYLGFPAYQAFVPEVSLSDFNFEEQTALLKAYLLGNLQISLMPEETLKALIPIFQNLEKKQIEYYN